ncbi:MAG: HAD family hydrolase [Prevotella sp.]|nr:HAD family hydrolase [Prevotella sp.]
MIETSFHIKHDGAEKSFEERQSEERLIERLKKQVKVIAFDADDTLWDCQSHFEAVENAYCRMLSPWGSEQYISGELFKIETANMPELGYGCKAFTLSLVENAVKVSRGEISAELLLKIQEAGRSLLRIPATPLPGVESTLRMLRATGRYRMVVFTKGEIQDQENKLRRSGLWDLFDRVDVVADKTARHYRELCEDLHIGIAELLMVGNSFKSDIEPVLAIGGYAVHVPFEVVWAHEHMEAYAHNRLLTFSHFDELKCLAG